MRAARFLKARLSPLMERFRTRGLILLYHRVTEVEVDPWQLCVSPRHFEEHLAVLKKFRPARLCDLPESVRPGSVAVTFDDGYADNLHCAARLLRKYDIPATFFLTSGYLGGNAEFWWDELERRLALAGQAGAYYETYDRLQPLAHAERREILEAISGGEQIESARESHRVLKLEEVSELASLGELVEIGAHTVTHPRLAAHSAADQSHEMRESKRFLEEVAGREVRSFSYPFGGRGHYNDESVRMAREAGFSAACTTTPRAVDRACNRFELPRVVVEDMDGDRFEKLLHRSMLNRN
jgi:peptidoglycan/xylan/chitin deacetylase (PgdA/CDA1 family)